MSEYEVLIDPDVATFVADEKGRAGYMLRDQIDQLEAEPHPDENASVVPLPFGGPNWYWLKIRRVWSVFFLLDEAAGEVRVVDVQDQREADSRYGI